MRCQPGSSLLTRLTHRNRPRRSSPMRKRLKLPSEIRFSASHEGCRELVELQAADPGAEPAGDGKRLPRFKMTAYTGGKMVVAGFPLPVVIDLAGMKVPAKQRPILRAHDPNQ